MIRSNLRKGESFVAVLEVCGFNDWLILPVRQFLDAFNAGAYPELVEKLSGSQ